MSKLYSCLPSEIMGIEDDYTAFCFNEACSIISVKLHNEEKPVYREQKQEGEQKKVYHNFSDFYKDFE